VLFYVVGFLIEVTTLHRKILCVNETSTKRLGLGQVIYKIIEAATGWACDCEEGD